MNDFFTELDAQLLSLKTPTHAPIQPPKKITPVTPIVPKAASTPHAPKHKPNKTGNHHKPNDSTSHHITEMRTQMMKAWVVAIVFKADEQSKALLGHLKLETRGFAHLDEVREVHKMIIKKARASYEDTLKDVPDIEEKDLIKIIRRDMEIFLQNTIDRIPVIIPMILYI